MFSKAFFTSSILSFLLAHAAADRPSNYVYVVDNSAKGSSVVALQSDQGVLSNPRLTSTNGFGSDGTNGTGFPNAGDPTFSQGFIAINGNYLFTANTGSNTVVAFYINPGDPQDLRMIGRPASTLGDFPVSVTVTSSSEQVCVLNGGKNAGVSCFFFDPNSGLRPDGVGLRTLDGFKQTTPPAGPPLTASQILISPDDSEVIAVVKGTPTGNVPGSFYVWSQNGIAYSRDAVSTSIKDVILPFGTVWSPRGELVVSDPTFGASLLALNGSGLVELAHTVIPNQLATCWAAISGDEAFGIDAANANLYELDADTSAYESTVTLTATNGASAGGGLEGNTFNNLLFVNTGSLGIAALDISSNKQTAYFDLSKVVTGATVAGLNVYP